MSAVALTVVFRLALGAALIGGAGCSGESDDTAPVGSALDGGGDESDSGRATDATTVADRCHSAFEAAGSGGEGGDLSDDPARYRKTLEDCVDVATWRDAAIEFDAQILTPDNSGIDAANILDFSLCGEAKETPVCRDAARLLDQPTTSNAP